MDESYNLTEILQVLRSGGILLYPTDTIWGIGCDATNAKAVGNLLKIKMRARGKSLIILVDSLEMLGEYVEELPEVAIDLMERINEPLTIIYPAAKNLARNVVAEDGSIAARVTRDFFCKAMIGAFGKPIISTSANISGDPSPLTFAKVSPKIIDKVDYVVPYLQHSINNPKPSPIIRVCPDGDIQIIRS